MWFRAVTLNAYQNETKTTSNSSTGVCAVSIFRIGELIEGGDYEWDRALSPIPLVKTKLEGLDCGFFQIAFGRGRS